MESMIVVGGGVIGMSCALSLQARGIAVIVVDPATLRAASLGNAGHIAVEQVEPLASWAALKALPSVLFARGGPVSLPLREIGSWLPFALRFARAAGRFELGKKALASIAAAALPAWRRQLEHVAARELLIENGHFVVWETAAAADEGRRRWAAAETGTVTVRGASEADLAVISAHLKAPLAGGVRFEGSAQIADLEKLAAALVRAFERGGGVRVRGAAESVGPREVLLETGERLEADAVLVAAGAASGALLLRLGHKVPLIAERGYHLQARETDWPEDLPPVVFEERAMIVTRFHSGLRAAGFFEFGRAAAPPDPRKWARLRSNLDALGIAFSDPVEWMGARPTLPDYLPAMGRTQGGLFYAFGHQHLGLTLAAATGEAVAALAAGERPLFDLEPFAIERFGR